MTRHSPAPAPAAPSWGARLASPGLLYGILPALIALSVLGTLIPQGGEAAGYAGRFGVWAGIILRLGLNDVYHSASYIFLLLLLAVNLSLCTWRRRAGFARRPDVLTTHIGVLVVLAGGLVTAAAGQRGNLPLSVGEIRDHVSGGAADFHLPFSVRLAKFTIERHAADRHRVTVVSRADGWTETAELDTGAEAVLHGGAARLKALAYYPDFIMGESGPATRSQSPSNPALRLEVSDAKGPELHWAFARFAGFHAQAKIRYELAYELIEGRVKQYRSDVEILEGGWVKARAPVAVNSPLRWKGWALYQSGFDPENPDYSILVVSRDPGVPVVYAGFALLSLGVAWAFARGRRQP